MKIHTTIGLYPNRDYVVNGVADEDIKQHVQYNKDWRPGRALFVNGDCVHQGYTSAEECEEFIKSKRCIIMTECTAPYI